MSALKSHVASTNKTMPSNDIFHGSAVKKVEISAGEIASNPKQSLGKDDSKCSSKNVEPVGLVSSGLTAMTLSDIGKDTNDNKDSVQFLEGSAKVESVKDGSKCRKDSIDGKKSPVSGDGNIQIKPDNPAGSRNRDTKEDVTNIGIDQSGSKQKSVVVNGSAFSNTKPQNINQRKSPPNTVPNTEAPSKTGHRDLNHSYSHEGKYSRPGWVPSQQFVRGRSFDSYTLQQERPSYANTRYPGPRFERFPGAGGASSHFNKSSNMRPNIPRFPYGAYEHHNRSAYVPNSFSVGNEPRKPHPPPKTAQPSNEDVRTPLMNQTRPITSTASANLTYNERPPSHPGAGSRNNSANSHPPGYWDKRTPAVAEYSSSSNRQGQWAQPDDYNSQRNRKTHLSGSSDKANGNSCSNYRGTQAQRWTENPPPSLPAPNTVNISKQHSEMQYPAVPHSNKQYQPSSQAAKSTLLEKANNSDPLNNSQRGDLMENKPNWQQSGNHAQDNKSPPNTIQQSPPQQTSVKQHEVAPLSKADTSYNISRTDVITVPAAPLQSFPDMKPPAYTLVNRAAMVPSSPVIYRPPMPTYYPEQGGIMHVPTMQRASAESPQMHHQPQTYADFERLGMVRSNVPPLGQFPWPQAYFSHTPQMGQPVYMNPSALGAMAPPQQASQNPPHQFPMWNAMQMLGGGRVDQQGAETMYAPDHRTGYVLHNTQMGPSLPVHPGLPMGAAYAPYHMALNSQMQTTNLGPGANSFMFPSAAVMHPCFGAKAAPQPYTVPANYEDHSYGSLPWIGPPPAGLQSDQAVGYMAKPGYQWITTTVRPSGGQF